MSAWTAGDAVSRPQAPTSDSRNGSGQDGVEVSALAVAASSACNYTRRARPGSHRRDGARPGCCTYFDTAPSYNNGQSETNYGRCCPTPAGRSSATRPGSYPRRHVWQRRAKLRTSPEDHVDLIQIHASPNGGSRCVENPRVLNRPPQARDQKVTRFIGLTGTTARAIARGDRALRTRHVLTT